MLVVNLAEPQWTKVHCNKTLANIIYCQREIYNHILNYTEGSRLIVCQKSFLLISNICYNFVWTKAISARKMRSQERFPEEGELQVLFAAASETFPPIFSMNVSHLQTYSRCSKTYMPQKKPILSESATAFHIHSEETVKIHAFTNIFQCLNTTYISIYFVCDGINDCTHNDQDVVGCECTENEKYTHKCKYLVGQDGGKSCSLFYITTHSGDCAKVNIDFDGKNKEDGQGGLKSSLTPDKISEFCKRNRSEFCAKHGQLPCTGNGHPCYNISQLCRFQLKVHGHLIPCGTGDHIQSCKDFTCNIQTITAFPGPMCVMESQIVQVVLMRTGSQGVVQSGSVLIYSNVVVIKSVYIWEMCVMNIEIVHMAMTSCFAHSIIWIVHLTVNVCCLHWDAMMLNYFFKQHCHIKLFG